MLGLGAQLVGLVLVSLALFAMPRQGLGADQPSGEKGTLRIFVTDGATGDPTPVRLEVLDAESKAHVPSDALPAPGECSRSKAIPWWNELSQNDEFPSSIVLPYRPTGSEHFYVLENGVELRLKPGKYTVRARKGPEYRLASTDVEIVADKAADVALVVERWIDMAELGWFSADDHLHVTRRSPRDNEFLVRWFEAEDLNVACLLEMGYYKGLVSAPQYAFGAKASFRQGRRLLVAGQENPRTWQLGHGIILGADSYIDFPERYLIYDAFWEEAKRQDALSGYAHWALGPGFALDLPSGNLDFVELLQRDYSDWEPYYRGLNLGSRLTSTAGADYPCVPGAVPGRNRFYTKIDGDLSETSWLEGLRRGRTFITNGPMIEFRVDEAEIGDTIEVEKARMVAVSAVVQFDPDRDVLDALEIVHDGQVVAAASSAAKPGRIELKASIELASSGWLAARATGRKVRGEPAFGIPLGSIAHTAPIYVRSSGSTATSPEAKAAAQVSLELLEKLRSFVVVKYQRRPKLAPAFVGFDIERLVKDAPELYGEIQKSMRFYQEIVTGEPVEVPEDDGIAAVPLVPLVP